MRKRGFVYLVGAGPGRADLITLRGAELIKIADCIIYDKLANPALLTLARPDAEIIHVPKRIGAGSFTQDQVNQVLGEKASAGKVVVRLKGGDPCIFGRCTEEAELLNDLGVGFEIVPGITAAIAGAEYSGIMLTDRRYSSQVAFITGREADGKTESNIDWDVLAKFPGTLVFYMGIGALAGIAKRLIDCGRAPETPVALVANATLPNQRVVRGPLNEIAETANRQGIEPPALIVVGPAAEGDESLNWFMTQPLFGKTIVVTRDAKGNADVADRIFARGGNPIQYKTFGIKPLTDTNEFVRALATIDDYDWVVFTSPNGVAVFFDALYGLKKDARFFGATKVATLGAKTAEALIGYGIRPDFVPTTFTGRALGTELMAFTNLHGKKILLLRSQLASKELPEVLAKAEAIVDEVATYTAVPETDDRNALSESIQQGRIDWLTFASPSAVRAFFEQIPPATINASGSKVASIGPVTSAELKELGVRIVLEAQEHTTDGMLDAIEAFEAKTA